ncbi:MAG: (5-formylfuran-3-yl)methyl phosphate synthase, partial [Pirellulales bacterium]|nr:(5-formylfuran-3-yl)methyl phosphate synthase [Pirellulales bacterium]
MINRDQSIFDPPEKSLAAAGGQGTTGRSAEMPQLLVSVRDLEEVCTVHQQQVDVIDLKEPLHGPLAPVDPKLWRQAVQTIRRGGDHGSSNRLRNARLSAALGELPQGR